MLNRKFVQTDDAMKDSEETALQQPSMWVKLAITRERSFSLLIHESKSKRKRIEADRIATVEQLQLEHTHSQLYSIRRATTRRGIIITKMQLTKVCALRVTLPNKAIHKQYSYGFLLFYMGTYVLNKWTINMKGFIKSIHQKYCS